MKIRDTFRRITVPGMERSDEAARDPVTTIVLGLTQTGILMCLIGASLIATRSGGEVPAVPEPREPNFTVSDYSPEGAVSIIDCTESPRPSSYEVLDIAVGKTAIFGIGRPPDEHHDDYQLQDAYLLRIDSLQEASVVSYLGGLSIITLGVEQASFALDGGELVIGVAQPGMISAGLDCR